MASAKASYAAAKRRLRRSPRSARALELFLRSKGRLGRYDSRMNVYRVPMAGVSSSVKRFLARAYYHGLVATATTNGTHAPNSLHKSGRAGDVGLRGPEVGTVAGLHKMQNFQRSEYRRNVLHRLELIGPINNQIVLRGRKTVLAEGTALEQAHDNHVHEGFSK